MACASAGVKDMTAAQQTYLGTNPPQLNALAPDDSLVLLTLGGDDMGFLNVLDKCMELSFTDPWGSPCQAYYTQGGTDQLAAAVAAEAPRMAAVLAAIAARAPQARIVVVGYPDLFPLSGGCWPAVPITDGDVAYLRGIELQLNAMLAAGREGGQRHVRRTPTRRPSATTSASPRGSGTSRACFPARGRSRSTPTPAARRPSPPPCSPPCGRLRRVAWLTCAAVGQVSSIIRTYRHDVIIVCPSGRMAPQTAHDDGNQAVSAGPIW